MLRREIVDMGVSLEHVKSVYGDYSEVVDCFSEEVISSRIDQIYQEMMDFIEEYDLEDTFIDINALTHGVFDYFSDIKRLKDYQNIENSNPVKIKAYETEWILRRHPIQTTCDKQEEKYMFINERFLLMRIASFMIGEKMNLPLIDSEREAFENFMEHLMYYLKFRECNAKAIELMLLAFEAGRIFG